MDAEWIGAVAAVLAAAFTAWAAYEARIAAKSAVSSQREQAIDSQWMLYQEFYGRCIDLYKRYPGMPVQDYLHLNGDEQRRLHMAAVAILQTLDLAYRAGDVTRVQTIKQMLIDHQGPLVTDGAIRIGAIADQRTLDDWNAIRALHQRGPLTR